MFSSKLGFVVLALSASAAALSNVQASTSPTSGGTVAVTWSSDASDTAPFTISLFSTSPTFNGGFAIANNVNPQDNKATIALPNVVPGPGYAISFISMSDTSNVLATSPSFSIGTAASASVSTPAVSNTGAVSSVSGASRSGSTAGGRAPAASSARSTSASATAPLSSASASVSASLSSASASISASLSSAASSISQDASSLGSSARSVASSALSSAASAASPSPSAGGARPLGASATDLMLVLGGVLLGVAAV